MESDETQSQDAATQDATRPVTKLRAEPHPEENSSTSKVLLLEPSERGASNGRTNGNGHANGTKGNDSHPTFSFIARSDAPTCSECGSIMVPNGSCHKCINCGTTSGCS
jgi:hypothetical protein